MGSNPLTRAFQKGPDRVLHRVAQGSPTLVSLSHALALSDLIDIGIGSWGRRCLHRGWMLESQWDLQCLLAAVAHLGCSWLLRADCFERKQFENIEGLVRLNISLSLSLFAFFSGTRVYTCIPIYDHLCAYTHARAHKHIRTRTDSTYDLYACIWLQYTSRMNNLYFVCKDMCIYIFIYIYIYIYICTCDVIADLAKWIQLATIHSYNS